MTQSDAPNEGREEKTHDQILHQYFFSIKDIHKESIIKAMNDYADQQTKSLRDQLSKERENNEVLKAEVNGNHTAMAKFNEQLQKEREKLEKYLDKSHPDFPEWVESEEGKKCMIWPKPEVKYLYNSLFWAFDAGRNCVWKQYITQKDELEKERKLRKELVEAVTGLSQFYSEGKRLEYLKDLIKRANDLKT